MSNAFDDMRLAVEQARVTLRAADKVAGEIAIMICGRLHKVPNWVLVDLKRELQQFDAHKKEWKP